MPPEKHSSGAKVVKEGWLQKRGLFQANTVN